MNRVRYSISVKRLNHMCDAEDSGRYVKEFTVLAHLDKKIVGRLSGNMFDMMGLLESGLLYIFDETCVTERLYSMMYHGCPLSLTNDDIEKGFRPEFLKMINHNFGDKYDTHEHDDFIEGLWPSHYMATIGFVENIFVDCELRGNGIGNGLVSMLRQFRNSVDYMILQSHPNAAGEYLNSLNLTYDEIIAFSKTPEYRERFEKEQVRIDNFYKKIGFIDHMDNDHHWMIMGSEGLKALPQISKDKTIKHKLKKSSIDELGM